MPYQGIIRLRIRSAFRKFFLIDLEQMKSTKSIAVGRVSRRYRRLTL